ncbi:hypothetical protein WA158_006620 [Blastocystis sp. Blastoise]
MMKPLLETSVYPINPVNLSYTKGKSLMICDKPDREIGIQTASPVVWSNDGNYLAYVSASHSIFIYERNSSGTLSLLNTLTGHDQNVECLLFHPKSDILLSSNSEGIFIWNYKTNLLIKKISHVECEDFHESSVDCMCWGYDAAFLFTGSKDSSIKVWNVQQDYKYCETLQGHRAAINCLLFNKTLDQLYSSGRDSGICVWNISCYLPLVTILDGHLGDVTQLCLSTDEQTLFSGARDNTIRAWDLKRYTCIREIKDRQKFEKGCHQGEIRFLKCINNHDSLLSCANDGEMKLFHYGDLTNQNNNNSESMMVSIDDLLKGFIESDDVQSVINDELESSVTIFQSCGIWSGALNPSYKLIALSSSLNNIQIYDISNSYASPRLLQEFYSPASDITSLKMIDKNNLITSSKDHYITVFNSNNHAKELCLDFETSVNDFIYVYYNYINMYMYILIFIFMIEKIHIYAVGTDYKVKVYSLENNHGNLCSQQKSNIIQNSKPSSIYPCLYLEGHSGQITCIDCDAETNIIVTGNGIPTGIRCQSPLYSLIHHKAPINDVCISDFIDDTLYITSVGSDYNVYTYKWKHNKPVLFWKNENAHESIISCVCYGHMDTKHYLFTGGWDNTIKVWSLLNQELIFTLCEPHERITDLTVSPDGYYLAVSSYDNTIYLYSLMSNRCSYVAQYNNSDIPLSVTFNENTIICGTNNGAIRYWPLPEKRESFHEIPVNNTENNQ